MPHFGELYGQVSENEPSDLTEIFDEQGRLIFDENGLAITDQ